jgi:hypothetical protein
LAKNQNTAEKRRRETEKRQRSAEKLEKKRQRKLRRELGTAEMPRGPADQ